MKDKKLLEFDGNMVSVNMVLDEDTVKVLRRNWGNVKGIQAPLVGTYKNGFSVFIPWILRDDSL